MNKKRIIKSNIKNESVSEHTNSFYNSIRDMLNNLNTYKEVYAIIGGACGLVFTSLWNIACDIGYRGFADALSINLQYIQRDNNNILVSLLIILGIAVVFFPVFYAVLCLAKKTAPNKIVRHILQWVSVGVSVLPFLLVVLCNIFPSANKVVRVIIVPSCFLALIAVTFIMIYFPLVMIFVDNHRHLMENRNTDANSNSNERSLNNVRTKKVTSAAKSIGTLLLALLLFLLGIYFFGRTQAISQKEFEFLVDDFSNEFSFNGKKVYDNVILSQTDEYYYLSVCTLSNKDGKKTITVYPFYHSVVDKSTDSNELKIIRINFDYSEIEKGECNLLYEQV